MISGNANNIQIMGGVPTDDVEIMGFGTITSESLQGFGTITSRELQGLGAGSGADQTLIPGPNGTTQTVANAMFVENQRGKNLATSEKIGAVAVLLLLAGGVAYAMHKG